MSRLYLRCVICSRQQAEGIISGAGWGRLELPHGHQIEHPALEGSTLRVCPSCMSGNPNWQNAVLTSFGLASGFGPRPATL